MKEVFYCNNIKNWAANNNCVNYSLLYCYFYDKSIDYLVFNNGYKLMVASSHVQNPKIFNLPSKQTKIFTFEAPKPVNVLQFFMKIVVVDC